MDCDSETLSVPTVIRMVHRKPAHRKKHASAPGKTRANGLVALFDGGEMDPFRKSRSNSSGKSTSSRKMQWLRFKKSLRQAFHATTPGGKKKDVRRPYELRSSFQSQTENTEDASSEFYLSTTEMPTEPEIFSPLPEKTEVTKLVTKRADSPETSEQTETLHEPKASEMESTNTDVEKKTRPTLTRADCGFRIKPLSSEMKQNMRTEDGHGIQSIFKYNGLKEPLHFSLSRMDGLTLQRAPESFQTKLIGTEKWELSIPTIPEDKTAEFLSPCLERRRSIFLKGEEVEPAPKRVERRNAIIMESDKPKRIRPKLSKRRKAPTKPNSNKMERRNAILMHNESNKMERRNAILTHNESNKMERRSAVFIHSDELTHPKADQSDLNKGNSVRRDKNKVVQTETNRKKRKSKRSKSHRNQERHSSIKFQNQASTRQNFEPLPRFSMSGGLVVVSGLMLALFFAALPTLIDDFLSMHLLELTLF